MIYIFQSFLANEDIGDSLEGVEALITKHENFEKTLAAQEEKFKVTNYITYRQFGHTHTRSLQICHIT